MAVNCWHNRKLRRNDVSGADDFDAVPAVDAQSADLSTWDMMFAMLPAIAISLMDKEHGGYSNMHRPAAFSSRVRGLGKTMLVL